MAWHQDRRVPGNRRNGAGVQRPRPAAGDDGKLGRVLAALDGRDANGAGEVLFANLDDPLRRAVAVEPQPVPEGSHRFCRCGGIERLAGDPAEDNLRVEDRRLARAAQARRIGPAGSQPDHAVDRAVRRRGGPAADPARVDRGDRKLDTFDPGRRYARQPAANQRHVGGIGPDVDNDGVPDPCCRGRARRGNRRPGRPPRQRGDRQADGMIGACSPTGRVDDIDPGPDPRGAERAGDRFEPLSRPRPHAGVEHRRERPAEFPGLGRHTMRQDDGDLLVDFADQRLQPQLVRRIRIGMQQGDRHRIDPGADKLADCPCRRGLVKLGNGIAAGGDTLDDAPD